MPNKRYLESSHVQLFRYKCVQINRINALHKKASEKAFHPYGFHRSKEL